MQTPTRRSVLQSASLGGAVALTGCLPAAGSGPSDDPTETTARDEETPTESAAGDSPDIDEWILAANTLAGPTERYFADEVRVTVGSPRVSYAFTPAYLLVTPGTTVRWVWSIHGGANNVVAVDGTFDSGDPVDEYEHTFTYTFEDPGDYPYRSEPQADCGMRGLVRVESVEESGYPAVDRWLVDVDSYDGTVVDRAGRDAVTVAVGAEGNRGAFAFDPPAMSISPGTTVTWEWTGEGGGHNVVFEDADVGSDEIQTEAGATYSHTFESTGTYRYSCLPHQSLGQKGAIVVE